MNWKKTGRHSSGAKRADYDIAAILEEMRQQYWQGLEEQAEQTSEVAEEFLVFSLGGQSFGIPTQVAREVLRPPRLVRVPRVGELILGIFNLRGQVVAVTDLSPLLGLERGGGVQTGRLVIVEAAGLTTALAVDRVVGLRRFTQEQIEPLSQGQAGMLREAALGQVALDGELLILLNMEHLLGREEMTVDHKKV